MLLDDARSVKATHIELVFGDSLGEVRCEIFRKCGVEAFFTEPKILILSLVWCHGLRAVCLFTNDSHLRCAFDVRQSKL